MVAMVETEETEVVMEEMTQREEDLELERMKQPGVRPREKPFQFRKERLPEHVNVNHAGSEVTPEKAIPLNERQVQRMRGAETNCANHIAPRFFIQHPIIDIPAKASRIHSPDGPAKRAALSLHTFL